MDGSFKLGRLFGIPVLIHFTFLLIIPLFAWIIGSEITFYTEIVSNTFRISIDETIITAGFFPYILGVIIALGLFIGVYIHELAHSLIAIRAGIRIDSITLLFFGGVASIEEQEPEPGTEFVMALAGPLTSLAIGIICSLLMYLTSFVLTNGPQAGVLVFIFGYLAILNFLLFAFNLLPAFPMDGGRVLRAYLASRMPLHQATSIASTIGKGFAVAFGLIGLLLFSPILILIAFFIYIGAGQESAVTRYNFLLKDVTAGDVMSKPVMDLPPQMPLSEVLNLMYQTKHLGFPVTDRGILSGIITLTDLARTPVLDRDAMQVRDVMTRDVVTLPPHAPIMDALRIMTRQDIGRIPIVEDEKIVGIITKSDIFTVIELREL
ncbi:CBS domain-containing protein [Methanospirillum stamsii]|uniref:Zinc metalloprotease n=1 Tax=Methanospirillum stamsii TaxID=1277351 RepID=A0A2V2NF58_9EURY|nr:CBS domain-containing protein [Methanospirillum stamsii]PWR75028.1 peptidase M50 [Methanospirillum stamsii]